MNFDLDLDLDGSVPTGPEQSPVIPPGPLHRGPAWEPQRATEGGSRKGPWVGATIEPDPAARATHPVSSRAPAMDLSLDLSPRLPVPRVGAVLAHLRRLPVLRSVVPARVAAVPLGAEGVVDERGRAEQWLNLVPPSSGLLVVAPGTRIAGDCRAPCVWVRGVVTGRVTATRGFLVVDAGARVLGGIEGAGLVVVAGEVGAGIGRAAVVARGRLQLAGSAVVRGTIRHRVIALYDGAEADGDFIGLSEPRGGR